MKSDEVDDNYSHIIFDAECFQAQELALDCSTRNSNIERSGQCLLAENFPMNGRKLIKRIQENLPTRIHFLLIHS